MLKRLLGIATLSCITTLAFAGISDRADVQAFMKKMQTKHGFTEKELVAIFDEVEIQQGIIDAMNRPAEGKPWYQYRPLFITNDSINNGVRYYSQHKEALERAEKDFGVPAEVIVAIIGVETRYGRVKGSHKVLDALSTLAFEYPKRSPFFTKELEELLVLTKEEGIDPRTLKGSYAGAMGTPQFMPSSYRAYAIDFTGDGKRNLWTNDSDAIGSVANYFVENGWKTGEPVIFKADLAGPIPTKNDVKPHTPFKNYKKQGVKVEAPVKDTELTTLLSYDLENGKEYWLGLNNFYVITRYNRSPLYALAVYQLSDEIRERVKG